ncbi:hypothetical protein FB466_0403 [Klugiella xanthotipulae]|uniref:Uncharacterized protein n=1 Tax=Klugiella xanthotipulae TaxID=244735 RepID=A0A543I4R5_9MICO|nr:hypothetical protein FB466_0403 [Klugiella xanthotipulae]
MPIVFKVLLRRLRGLLGTGSRITGSMLLVVLWSLLVVFLWLRVLVGLSVWRLSLRGLMRLFRKLLQVRLTGGRLLLVVRLGLLVVAWPPRLGVMLWGMRPRGRWKVLRSMRLVGSLLLLKGSSVPLPAAQPCRPPPVVPSVRLTCLPRPRNSETNHQHQLMLFRPVETRLSSPQTERHMIFLLVGRSEKQTTGEGSSPNTQTISPSEMERKTKFALCNQTPKTLMGTAAIQM